MLASWVLLHIQVLNGFGERSQSSQRPVLRRQERLISANSLGKHHCDMGMSASEEIVMIGIASISVVQQVLLL